MGDVIAADALLNPKSVAVVGASDKASSFGGQVVRNLVDFGYPGKVYAVHPRLSSLFDRPCVPSLDALPERPDCVALAVSNRQLMSLLEQAAALGIPSAVVFGDPTVGEGRAPELQTQIAALARRQRIAVCGPNAMGVYNLREKLVISGYPVRPDIPVGEVALVTHSGTVFDAMSQNNRSVSFNYVISCGNEAVLSVADYLHHVLDDPSTRVVALYLETVRNPAGFIKGLERAVERRIPIVALKVGLSEHGQAMTQAHTGALAGGAEAYAALFEKYGVSQVYSLDEMMDAVELFGRVRDVPKRSLAVLMESGGERSLVADHAAKLSVRLARFSEKTHLALRNALDAGVEPDNPLDAFGTGHRVTEVYQHCLSAMDTDTDTGLLLLAVDLARDSYLSPQYVEAALAVRASLEKPLVAMVNLSAGAHPGLMQTLRERGVPVLMGTATGLMAIRHLFEHDNFVKRGETRAEYRGRPSARLVEEIRARLCGATAAFDEHQSKTLLSHYGLEVTRERLGGSRVGVLEIAAQLGYPVVLKTAGALHKSDVGGIHLDLGDAQALSAAYDDLCARLGPKVLVQKMIGDGTELIFGMTSDPQFGPLLVVGLGGIFVEIYRDVVTVMPPLSQDKASELFDRLRGRAMLAGARGRPAADRDALCEALLRFSTFVADCGDLIAEIDINPIRVLPAGAVVLDALVVPKSAIETTSMHRQTEHHRPRSPTQSRGD